jgi:hypothetical protein
LALRNVRSKFDRVTSAYGSYRTTRSALGKVCFRMTSIEGAEMSVPDPKRTLLAYNHPQPEQVFPLLLRK